MESRDNFNAIFGCVIRITPETKSQSAQWVSPGERRPKKAKMILSVAKILATIFWDSQSISLIDYLKKGGTTNNANLLCRFDAVTS